MISVRFFGNLTNRYYDIFELELEPKSCSGADYISQEGRIAEFGIVADEFIANNIVNGALLAKGYLGVYGIIKVDETDVFYGIVRADSEVIHRDGFDEVRIQLCDLLYVFLDFMDGVTRELTRGQRAIPQIFLVYAWAAVKSSMPTFIANIVQNFHLDTYSLANWYPYYVPNEVVLDWNDTNLFPVPEYGSVLQRYFVMYPAVDGVMVEYMLYDTTTVVIGEYPSPVSIDHYQHLYWRKFKLSGTSITFVDGSGQQFADDSGFIQYNDPLYIAAYINSLPKLYDNYTITADNGINNVRFEEYAYVRQDSKIYLGVHPSLMVEVVPNEGEETTIDVDAGTMFRDMLMLMGAWAEPGIGVINIKNKQMIPAETYYEIGDDELADDPVRRANSSGSMELDCSYLVNGELMQDALNDYLAEQEETLMPFSFEFSILKGIHAYSIGEAVSWGGYNMMVISIDDNPEDSVMRIETVGSKAE